MLSSMLLILLRSVLGPEAIPRPGGIPQSLEQSGIGRLGETPPKD